MRSRADPRERTSVTRSPAHRDAGRGAEGGLEFGMIHEIARGLVEAISPAPCEVGCSGDGTGGVIRDKLETTAARRGIGRSATKAAAT